jgi:hypothetical protein
METRGISHDRNEMSVLRTEESWKEFRRACIGKHVNEPHPISNEHKHRVTNEETAVSAQDEH